MENGTWKTKIDNDVDRDKDMTRRTRKARSGRRLLWLSGGLAILLSTTIVLSRRQENNDVIRHEVVAVYPHDPTAYTQGLYFENGFLFEGTGRNGQSYLRRVDLQAGTVLQEAVLPAQFFGEGIAAFGDRIYQLTWTSGTGFIYDRDSFEVEAQFSYSREGWGLTEDGTNLIMSDGSSYLYFLDPETQGLVRQIEVMDANGPIRQLNELEYIQDHIYSNVWYTNQILKISPETGQVVGRLDLSDIVGRVEVADPDGVLNGIAYDEETDRVFVTGKLWPSLFEIRFRR